MTKMLLSRALLPKSAQNSSREPRKLSQKVSYVKFLIHLSNIFRAFIFILFQHLEQREARSARSRKQLFFKFSVSFTEKGLHHICFPRYFSNILHNLLLKRTLEKQSPVGVISTRSSESCGKSPEKHLWWSPLCFFVKPIPMPYCWEY